MLVHAMFILDIPAWSIKDMIKIFRGFLWKDRKDVHVGHCLVAWDKVCMPKDLGNLEIPNLRLINIALCARWPWLDQTMAEKPCEEFNIQVPAESLVIFNAATRSIIGDGSFALI